jgi:thiol-disulfide isomerase/thioredoxin
VQQHAATGGITTFIVNLMKEHMKRSLVAFLLLLSSGAIAQNIQAMSMDEIIRKNSSKDTVYIINFWATWCAPCVQELPEFNDLKARYEGKNVKVLLVSLDFKEDYPMKLGTFLQRKRITPEVVWLTDTNPNEFIPKVDNSWGGSIPATLIIHTGSGFKKFIEGQVSEKQVNGIVKKLIP